MILILQLGIISCNSEKKVEVETKTTEVKDDHKEGEEHKESGQAEHKDEHGHEEKEGQVEVTKEQLKELGLKTVTVSENTMPKFLKTSGEIQENENFTTHVTSRLAGRVTSITKSVGESVQKGDVLAVIESKDIANSQSELIEAQSKITFLQKELQNRDKLAANSIAQQQKFIDFLRQTYDRQLKLFKDDIAPRKNVEEVDKNLKTAILEKEKIRFEAESSKQQLRGEINNLEIQIERISKELQLYNFTPAQVQQLKVNKKLNTDVTIFSPATGLISQRHLSLGEVIDTEKEIFTIINPSAVWLYANIYEKDLGLINIGQSAYFITRGNNNSRYNAVVDYITPQVNDETRTTKIRLNVTSNTNILRKGMFADVFINVGQGASVITVPKESIQRVENKQVVYVKKEETVYQATPVVTGVSDDKSVEIKSGLKEGEKVVTKGSFTLKAMSQKDEMGEHDH